MCQSINRTWFIFKAGLARLSSRSVWASQLAAGWIAILIGDIATLFIGDTTILVPLIGGMSRHVRETIIKQPSGVPTIIQVPLVYITETGAMARRIISRRRHHPAGQDLIHRFRDGHLLLRSDRMNRQAAHQCPSPDPLRLPFNILNLSIGRSRTVLSSASKIPTIQKLLVIAASRVSSRPLVRHRLLMPRRFRGLHRRHPRAAAVLAVEIIQTTRKGVEHFQSNDFSPNIVLDEPRLPFMVTQIQVAGVLSRACDPDFHAARMRVGCG